MTYASRLASVEFSRYSCSWPGKKLIPITDLEAGIDTNALDTLVVSCQLNGTYDINIQDWTCTKPCPPPETPEYEPITHDWPSAEISPEIYQQVVYFCSDPTRHLVSKSSFETGAETNFLQHIMSMCLVTGWLNETIGSYTCTRGCEEPQNYTTVFAHDWDASKGSDIGTVVKFTCLNALKKVVNLKEDAAPLLDFLPMTCLYNGKYDVDIFSYGCTGKLDI